MTRSMLARFRRAREGTTIVEFALLAIPFFLLVFGILNTALVFAAQLTLDNAVAKAAREVQTGKAQGSQTSQKDFSKLICDDVSFILSCDGLIIDLKDYGDFASVPTTAPISGSNVDTTGFGYALSAASTVTALRVFYKWPISTDIVRPYLSNVGDGSRLLVAMAVFRTEPF